VVSQAGDPISGVTVRFSPDRVVYRGLTEIRSAEAVTDASGRFRLSFLSCGSPAGEYSLTAQKIGFRSVKLRARGVGKHRIVLAGLKVL
jgi:hypothetical protein